MRSNEEKLYSEHLTKLGIKWQYESHSVILIDDFVDSMQKKRKGSCYTPDFYFHYKGYDIFIEYKGYLKYVDWFKYKYIEYKLSKIQSVKFMMVKWNKKTNEFYQYGTKEDWFKKLNEVIKG